MSAVAGTVPPSSRRRRRAAVAAAAALGMSVPLALSACGFACNERGYSNVLRLTVAGADLSAIADVQLCADDVCAQPPQDFPPATGPSYWVVHEVAGLWVYDFGTALPGTVELSFLDDAGRVLEEQAHPIDWNRTDEPNGPGCGWQAEPYDLSVTV